MEPFVTNRYVYGPYGEPLHYDNEKERQGFIGKEKDLESGLADHGVRKYDYISGRFTSVDPLSEKFYSMSSYQYSFNNPITTLDENGREPNGQLGSLIMYGKMSPYDKIGYDKGCAQANTIGLKMSGYGLGIASAVAGTILSGGVLAGATGAAGAVGGSFGLISSLYGGIKTGIDIAGEFDNNIMKQTSELPSYYLGFYGKAGDKIAGNKDKSFENTANILNGIIDVSSAYNTKYFWLILANTSYSTYSAMNKKDESGDEITIHSMDNKKTEKEINILPSNSKISPHY